MGRALPGYRIALLDEEGREVGDEGEVCIDPRPAGLMAGYEDDPNLNEFTMRHDHHTGDVASGDEGGYITYVGRADDVFKLGLPHQPLRAESALIEHDAVAEAAVVPSRTRCAASCPRRSSF